MPSSHKHSSGRAGNQDKRNERERKRVHEVNNSFESLRKSLARSCMNKKLSKAETLREAIKYIQHLQSVLHADGGFPVQQGFPSVSSSCGAQMPQYYQEYEMYFPQQVCSPIQHISPAHSQSYSPPQQYYHNYGPVMHHHSS